MTLRATLGGLVDISIDASATILVAASNSLNPSRTTYQCDGTADNVQITAAITALPAGGGKIMLTEGTFNLAAGIVITKSNVVIEGMGNSTIIATPALADDFFKFTTMNYVRFKSFKILGTNQTAGNGIRAIGTCVGCTVDNVMMSGVFGEDTVGSIQTLFSSPATIVVAASDAKYPEKADLRCDGTADQEEINLAFAALPTNGGKILLSDGTFNISNHVGGYTPYDNVVIEGQGPGSVLKMIDEPLGLLTSGALIGENHVHVDDVTGFATGQWVQIEAGAGADTANIVLSVDTVAKKITFTNVLTKNHAIGQAVFGAMNLFFNPGSNNQIRNLKIDGNVANWTLIPSLCGVGMDIITQQTAEYLIIDNVEMTNTRQIAITGASSHIIIRDVYVHDCGGAGIMFESIETPKRYDVRVLNTKVVIPDIGTGVAFSNWMEDRMVVRDCYFKGPVSLTAVTDASIEDTYVLWNSGTQLINIQGCHNVVLDGCVFDGAAPVLTQDATPYITLYKPIFTSVTKCFFKNGAYYLIYGDSKYTVLDGNYFESGATAACAIEISGSGATDIVGVKIVNNTFNGINAQLNLVYGSEIVIDNNDMFLLANRNTLNSCTNVSISNNRFITFAKSVWGIVGTSANVRIDDNEFKTDSSGWPSIVLSGSALTTPISIRRNLFVDCVWPIYNPSAFTNVNIEVSSTDVNKTGSTTNGIQEALTLIYTVVPAGGGGQLHIPAGTHNITTKITVPSSYFHIYGDGPLTVIATPGIADDMFYINGRTNVVIENLTIDCTNQSAGSAINANGTCIDCYGKGLRIITPFSAGVTGVFGPRHTQTIQPFLAYSTNGLLAASFNNTYSATTQPDVARNLVYKKTGATANGGQVIATGTDLFGNVATETTVFAGGAATTVGTKIFASINTNGIVISALTAGDTIEVGVGNKLGLDHKIFTGAVKKVTKSGVGNYVLTSVTEDIVYHGITLTDAIVASDIYQITSLDCMA